MRDPFDDEGHHAFKLWLKKQRMMGPRELTLYDKLDILSVQAYLRHEAFKKELKSGRKTSINFTLATADALQRSNHICQKVWKDYIEKNQTPSVAPHEGPRGVNQSRIPRTPEVKQAIRDWLHERNLKRQRTVANDVLNYLIDQGILPATIQDDAKARMSALRTVQRFVNFLGFKRGNRRGQQTFVQREELIRKRDEYVINMCKLQETRRCVFLDESFIHRHYKCHDDSLYDPEDSRPLPKDSHKGSRYCFIAAILSKDPLAPESSDNIANKAQFMFETFHMFTPHGSKQRASKKETADYPGMFDTAYFNDWMKKLLDALEIRGVKNSIIIMDNAKYHKTLPANTPKQGWTKAQLIQACMSRGIPIEDGECRSTIWARLKAVINNTVVPEVVAMAKAAGFCIPGPYNYPHTYFIRA